MSDKAYEFNFNSNMVRLRAEKSITATYTSVLIVVNCFSFAESRFKLSVHFKVLADELDFLLPQWLFTEISKICNFTEIRSNLTNLTPQFHVVVNCFQDL